ncbi:hypothetical protein [Ralstonia pseudosolanacearum]|uniref:hypothetical protein n=1 Tax=Ralstonia pseudosolanacearum TaxID=1310165 RepID=UPI001FF75B92|nr:hypothetical protein [Ralstonia pseudosolanacearum]
MAHREGAPVGGGCGSTPRRPAAPGAWIEQGQGGQHRQFVGDAAGFPAPEHGAVSGHHAQSGTIANRPADRNSAALM